MVKNSLQCRRPGFNSWAGKIPWRRERIPTPAFWPGEFHGLYSPWSRKESDTTERLSLSESPRKLLQDQRVHAKGSETGGKTCFFGIPPSLEIKISLSSGYSSPERLMICFRGKSGIQGVLPVPTVSQSPST